MARGEYSLGAEYGAQLRTSVSVAGTLVNLPADGLERKMARSAQTAGCLRQLQG